jgi:hypothetical protein
MIFEVYSIYEKNKWKSRLNEFSKEKLDIYYLPEYYETWISEERAEPICVYAKINNSNFLYTFFKKEITEYDLDKKYYDIFSAYGYGGVVSDVKDKKDVEIFNKIFNEWCYENNIIAEFIRENPAINKKKEYIRDALYLKVRTNVYVKTEPDYKIPSSSARRNIKKAIKSGLYVEIDEDLETIDEFIKLYDLTAKRLKMDKYYLFSKEYFYNQKKYLIDNVKLINIKFEDKIISSTLFYYRFNKAVYHLSASNFNFQNLRPNDLLLNEMIEESKRLRCLLLSLGGGTTDKEDDSLFIFKKRFGQDLRDVFIGKKVHNQKVYNLVCNLWQEKYSNLVNKYKNMFLKYRFVE